MVTRKTRVSQPPCNRDATPFLPRVVILAGEGKPRVEVLELPESTGLGALFRHRGTRWLVTDLRTGERVLIARPARA